MPRKISRDLQTKPSATHDASMSMSWRPPCAIAAIMLSLEIRVFSLTHRLVGKTVSATPLERISGTTHKRVQLFHLYNRRFRMQTSTLDYIPGSAVRRHSNPMTWVALALYLFSVGMILGGILMAPRDHPTFWFQEHQTLTSYSAALLFTSSLVCFLNCLVIRQMRSLGMSSQREYRFWALGSFGFFYLMADEYFVMHEGIGRFFSYRLLNLHHSGQVDRLDAFVIGTYGVIGLTLLVRHWRDLANIRGFFGFLTTGAVMAVVSLVFDLGEDGTVNLYIEDGAKILANASFLLACTAAAYGSYRQLVARLH
jgi:hypothetical protein